MSDNPLAEASLDSLSELFSRDPLQLSDADIDRITLTLREKRKLWREAEAAGATKAPREQKAPKAPKATSAEIQSSLQKLGF